MFNHQKWEDEPPWRAYFLELKPPVRSSRSVAGMGNQPERGSVAFSVLGRFLSWHSGWQNLSEICVSLKLGYLKIASLKRDWWSIMRFWGNQCSDKPLYVCIDRCVFGFPISNTWEFHCHVVSKIGYISSACEQHEQWPLHPQKAVPHSCKTCFMPSGHLLRFAIENGPVEPVDLPIDSMVDLSIVMLVYQRVIPLLTIINND